MLYNYIRNMFRGAMYPRCDENGCIFYFTADDFPGLHKTPYTVPSRKGYTLQGYFYSYDAPIPDRVVVFEHGMGSGHTGYMKEIELLCRHGYRVFAYDHSGCMESGGDDTGGFMQSTIDCCDVLDTLEKDASYQDMRFSVIGHSWGGLSTLNIAAYHPEITHLVALAAPISLRQVITYMLPKLFRRYGEKLFAEEMTANPEFAGGTAQKALANTRAHALIIHSDDDPLVSCQYHFDVLEKDSANRPNTRFVKVTGKAHNPNYTEDAVKYKDAFFADYQKVMKKKQLTTDAQKAAFRAKYDWNRMTVQDTELWDIIFQTLDKPAVKG